jgi:excinuclease ABC subunit A
MTIEEALEFFNAVPNVRAKLQTLFDVGLGYVHLGQPATTLSGGEAQRVKLATELSRRATGRTLYVLDEPTTGLHFADVEKLLQVLHRLVETGNTVVVIEHNLDVVKTADWIVDLGPEGGSRGGRIVAQGTPEEVSRVPESATGEYLARVLRGEPLIPLSHVSFAEEAGRSNGRTNGRGSRTVRIAPIRKRAAAAR